MKLYTLQFRVVDKRYSPERLYAIKVNKTSSNQEVLLTPDGLLTVLEKDIAKYWEYGGGVAKVTYAGEMDDELFKPTMSEQDFVDEQIKSKKTGQVIGYQG